MKKLKFKKKILLLTTNRSDYGLLRKLILEINKNKYLDLKLVVAGSHLLKKYGNTINEIKKDKIKIFKTIKVNYDDDSISAVSMHNLNLAKRLNNIFSIGTFDYFLILGDRSEILFCSALSLLHNIKIIHLHGGEKTLGSIDNQIRNSISQLATYHFAAHENYKKRIIKMGIDRKKVFLVGGLGASSINSIKTYSKKIIQKKINVKLNKKYFLVTYHPTTVNEYYDKNEFKNLMECLNTYENVIKIVSAPNLDANNYEIINIINYYVKNKKNFYYFKSLGSLNYYSLMKYSCAVVGNSSSGILEAPSFKKPTINIGMRQLGRIQAKSIVNCSSNKKSIMNALNKVMKNKSFQKSLKKVKNPFFQKNSEKKIINELLKI
jgi:GDP/UDP-N,N'-diacetylbacillosamine 2-epimerase (hydrolysing)